MVNGENLHYFGVYTAAMGFTHIWCYKNTVRKRLRKVIRKPNSFNRPSKKKKNPNGNVARKTYSLHKILQEKTSPEKVQSHTS